jgi:uncharacterized coiled-coil protein SlyX
MDAAPNWVTLLIQVPLVGVFIWYSLEMAKRSSESQKAFMESLEKRDTAFEIRNSAVIHAIDNLNAAICIQLKELDKNHEDHDRYVRDKLSTRSSRSKST